MWSLFSYVSALIDRPSGAPWRPFVGSDFPRVLGVLGVAVLGCLVLLAASVGLGALGRQIPIPAHFLYDPVTHKANRIPLLVSPSMSTIKLERWSMSAARELVSFNFLNADTHFQSQRDKFTDAGWAAFQDAMARTASIQTVKERHLVVTGIPTKRARVTDTLLNGPALQWQVEIPMLISYTGDNRPVNQSVLCTLILRQVPSSESAHGIAIAKITFRSYI